jgi:hypothetical protein
MDNREKLSGFIDAAGILKDYENHEVAKEFLSLL